MPGQIFGKKLKEMRIQRGLTQKELADLLFVTRRCIGNWESGRRKPDIVSLPIIASALEVDTGFFLDNDDEFTAISPNILIFDPDSSTQVSDELILKKILDKARIISLEKIDEAISFATESIVSIALIDIDNNPDEMFAFAENLKALNPKINLIFLSKDSKYALDALNLFCSGYIIKPLTRKKVSEQIKHLRFHVNELT
ncbi:helix-turn-helix domain-containing protein [Butyrivibrio sp. MC2021]|uniref:helix-turn-helix domain-containing protein n=1 Tax=Butyrivibrio sp. MC2021 TaxID=1408306 RepID=UPI00055A4CF9|nr:helix-turn-helix domain-containing protein [Butyrivibrio sp. MC2021]